MEKAILGHIDCPHCGEKSGMEVKHDKNSEPFGYCEYCAGQLRVGGRPGRVRSFCKMHPWAGNPPVTVTDTVPVLPPVAAQAPVTVTKEPAPARRRATFADALGALGVASKAVAP